MKVSILEILIGERRIGHLFKFADIVRLSVDPDYANDPTRPLLSLSMRAGDPERQAAFLMDSLNPALNSLGNGKLPAFFQNLLPEGVLRTHIALERKCDEHDHFEILAACGGDLPGNVYALPAHDPGLVSKLVTQRQDALEMSIVADPLEDGTSLSGMQPKLALVRDGGRFVAARHLEGGHVIGKLPTAQYDMLPQVEQLSLRLASAAGATVCETSLQPMGLITADHSFVLGRSDQFLAVERFDRDRPGRLHAEDFAQVLGIDPGSKYSGGSYADIARVLLAVDGIGEAGVHELVRRIAVAELLGNYDFHLKNIGLLHHGDGRMALSPAYDIVAYSVYLSGQGHALPFAAGLPKRQILDPKTLRAFANAVGVPEAPLRRIIKNVCEAALDKWPAMIAGSDILQAQKEKLMQFFMSRPLMESLLTRRQRHQTAKLPPDDAII